MSEPGPKLPALHPRLLPALRPRLQPDLQPRGLPAQSLPTTQARAYVTDGSSYLENIKLCSQQN